jgi:hypothetical protein
MQNLNTTEIENNEVAGLSEEELTVEVPTDIKAGRVQLSLPPCAYAIAAPAAAVVRF